jgi:hypothetical protein
MFTMKLCACLLATTASLAATGAFAETNYLAGTLGYGKIDYTGSDYSLSEFNLGGDFEGSTGAFTYGVDAELLKYSDGDLSFQLKSYNLDLGYAFSPSLTAVGGASRFEIFDETFNSYSLGLEYAYNHFTFGVGGRQMHSEYDGTAETGYGFVEYDNDTYSANLGYTEQWDTKVWNLGAAYDSDLFELELDAVTLDYDGYGYAAVSLDGKYNVKEKFRILAGLKYFYFDPDFGGEKNTEYALGAGYQVRDDLWLDATFGRANFNGESVYDTLRVGVTYEIGKRKLRTRDNLYNMGDYTQDYFILED